MTSTTILDDLYRYNRWANGRVLRLCDGLSPEQLDQKREMGFGSLRNTLFHILAAEEIWLERWNNIPWRPFPMDAEGLTLSAIEDRLHRVEIDRAMLIDRGRAGGWSTICQYKDSKGNAYSNAHGGLLVHVANHGIHHRAQALSYLKSFGRTVAGGIDYLFFRLSQALIKQEEATAISMRGYGLDVDSGSGHIVDFDAPAITRFFAYDDWANSKLLSLAAALDEAELNRSFGMGMDTIRMNLLHIQDAQRWWVSNWTTGPTAFGKAPETTSVAKIHEDWQAIIDQRNQFITSLTSGSAHRIVTVLVGAMSVRVQVIESLLQLFGHGTHHRAQLVNMFRHSRVAAPQLDYLYWLRETGN